MMLAALCLHGCASTASVGAGGATASRGPLQLFGADAKPRFEFYLACTSKTVNCEIVERAFDDWADWRHLSVHAVAPNDPAFSNGTPSATGDQARPYRVVVRYVPEMALSNSAMMSGGHGPPLVSYTATVHVFDSASGSLLKTQSFHDETVVDQAEGAANPYLNAQIRAFLGHLDPAYAKGGASS
ncbi:hypothetical protein DVT68_10315 [Dyella solisilvae]|uniref:Uncharacterized protein n=2 Tax=Dyella solisilvae TaxID=1920168 RepID=A0A370KA26_9GAMM|nr:hypothetical protein DVT68_10315 [Dyella solisilvae]